MLGSGLKNGILFLLIILIMHFLIKNILLERKRDSFVENVGGTTKEVIDKISATVLPQVSQEKSCEEKKQELYKYVMEAGDLEKIIPKADDKAFQDQYNLACDAQVSMETKDTQIRELKKTSGQPGSFLTIHEYKDESPLNGGNVFDGIGGYDGFDDVYQSYSCAK